MRTLGRFAENVGIIDELGGGLWEKGTLRVSGQVWVDYVEG